MDNSQHYIVPLVVIIMLYCIMLLPLVLFRDTKTEIQKDTEMPEFMRLITFNTELRTKQLGSYVEVIFNNSCNLHFHKFN